MALVTKFCPACNEGTTHETSHPMHWIHLIMTIFTGGLWGIIWLWRGLMKRPCVCSRCGCDNS
ncbi:hypothetical protein [Vibrio breoganii]|uniref:hypothetical protein n=1 Tax=Vibrio breoganii TaxID=553239 RepID=UPI00101AED60|nr:hypothetical protein [Vibrio breoganii]